jgi:hypothetical protein
MKTKPRPLDQIPVEEVRSPPPQGKELFAAFNAVLVTRLAKRFVGWIGAFDFEQRCPLVKRLDSPARYRNSAQDVSEW